MSIFPSSAEYKRTAIGFEEAQRRVTDITFGYRKSSWQSGSFIFQEHLFEACITQICALSPFYSRSDAVKLLTRAAEKPLYPAKGFKARAQALQRP